MPTIFDRLTTALSGSQLSANLTVESGNLTGVVTTVAGLISDPPDDLQDFVQGLAEAPLPDLNVAGDLGTSLDSIRTALPTDLGDVAGPLLTALGGIEDSIGLGLTNVLTDVLAAIQAIQQLLDADWTCGLAVTDVAAGSGASGGGGGAGGGGGGGGGEGSTATNRPTPEGIDQAIATLDSLPSPFNVENLLRWLHPRTDLYLPDEVGLRSLPFLQDLRDPLDTLLAWEGLDPAGILDHLSTSLQTTETFIQQSLDATLGTCLADLTALSAQFQHDTLAQIADELTARLGELRTAITGADLGSTSPIVDAINAQLDQYDTVRAAFEASINEALLALIARLETLPYDLEDQMSYVISVLQPSASLGNLLVASDLPDLSVPADLGSISTALEAWLTTYLAFFENLAAKIDVTALQEPLTTIADEVQAAVESLDQLLVTITLQVQSLFAQVEGLLDQVDTAAIMTTAQDAIDSFKNQVIQQLTDAFAPVHTALNQVVTQIDQTVDQFNPAALIGELQAAIDDIAGVLTDPEVTAVLDRIRQALDAVAQAIESLAFTPVTDEVVTAIGQLTDAVSAIDTSLLTAPLQMALQAAVSVLPQDLEPITTPLIDQFGQLIDAGPVPLIETVKDQPARLLDQVRSFDPGALIGDTLSAPFQNLLTEMEAFQPSQLLDSVESELDGYKDRLRQNASPGQLIAPLVPLHEQLMQSFDSLQPSSVVQPISDRIDQAVDNLIDALPVDEAFDQLDGVLSLIEDTLTVGDRFVALVQRGQELLADLADGPAQLQTWVDSILAQIDALADTSALDAHLAALSTAVDSTRAGALTATFAASVDPALALLDTLNAEGRLATLVQAYYAIPRPALEALPDSPEKAAAVAALDRFDPTQPAFHSVYQNLADLRTALVGTQTTLATVTVEWDTRYHPADGILAAFQQSQATAAQLRQWVAEELNTLLVQPLSAFFALVAPLERAMAALATSLQATVGALQTKLSDLLLGPGSLTDIRTSAEALVQRLCDVNLDFLTDSLDELFANVRAKLEALNPAQLQEALDTALEDMLESLSLDLVIPADSMTQLDEDYDDILDKFRQLDPAELVTNVIQPTYEQTVVPLIDAFDLTPLLTTIVDKLRALDDELREEMQRVNTAYQGFLGAVPDTSVSVSVSLPF